MKPKHQLLQELSEALLRRNPMHLKENDPLEYEDEALSMLSRFTESALHLASPADEETVVQVATNIVQQTLDFWFDTCEGVNLEELAREMLGIFRSGFEAVEEEQPKVTSVTIG